MLFALVQTDHPSWSQFNAFLKARLAAFLLLKKLGWDMLPGMSTWTKNFLFMLFSEKINDGVLNFTHLIPKVFDDIRVIIINKIDDVIIKDEIC